MGVRGFDSLDRGLVLQKLHHYGLRGTILEWYQSYFSGRRHKAKVNQCSSETKKVIFWKSARERIRIFDLNCFY